MDRSQQINSARIEEALDQAYALLSPWADTHRHERGFYHQVIQAVVRHKPGPNSRVIDLGCGVGVLPLALIKLGYQASGVEKYVFSGVESTMYVEPNIASLNKIWQDNGFKVFDYDITKPLPAEFFGQYDVVINTALIEHLKSPRLFLESAYQLLAAGGIIITMTPNAAVFYKRLRFLLGFSPWWDIKSFFALGENAFVGHWREYTQAELVYMHQQVGFKILRALNRDIFSLLNKINLRNLWHFCLRYAFYWVPNSREAHIIIAQK